jgi:predicted membrane channel-forming protein YqfA (hemolysin III family)
MFSGGGFTYGNFLMDVLGVFFFIIWFWLLITVIADLFRRHDASGWAKAFWVIFLIVLPYLGVLVYIIAQGRGMAQRRIERAQEAREEIRHVIGFSVADEITKLEALKNSGSITPEEFTRLRARLVQ